MRPIIFLDFDGPLFSDNTHLLDENMGDVALAKCQELNIHPLIHYWYANPSMIAWLNKMNTLYPYDLVVSSSWADQWLHEKKDIEAMLLANGLNFTMHQNWRTPRGPGLTTRAQELQEWLKGNSYVGSNYLILDDVLSGAELAMPSTYVKEVQFSLISTPLLLQENVFLASMKTGFSANDYVEMEKRLAQIFQNIKVPSPLLSLKP